MTRTLAPEDGGGADKPCQTVVVAPGPTKRSAMAWTTTWAWLAILVAIPVWTLGPVAHAQEGDDTRKQEFKDDISVVQRKPFLRKGRLELTPSFGTTVNDSLIQQFDVSGQLTYHISESIWIAGTFSWYDLGELGGVTDDYFEVLERASSTPDVVEMTWYAGARVGYVPLFGKFALFNSVIIYYDLSLMVGGGYATYITNASGGETGSPAWSIGLQQRIFLTDWLALQIALNDTMFLADLRDGPDSSTSSLTHIFSIGAGASIFIPFSFDYTTER
ncbi:MAG: outer membrane beta-barrel domain-containing protein [Myxococcota bacterium]